MPHKDGVEVLEHMMSINADVPVIMISGHGDINTAVDCLKKVLTIIYQNLQISIDY